MLHADKVADIWTVFFSFDEYYDNNIYVRAKSKKEAFEKAKEFSEPNKDDSEITTQEAYLIASDVEALKEFEELINNKDEDAIALYKGKIEGYLYDAGT
jgi:hypothetical protein